MNAMLGNCQISLNSGDCALNSYCPLPNQQQDSWCRKCNSDMVPGFSCNCLNNLKQNCAECDYIDCSKCIKGYTLENGKCIPGLGTCDQSQNQCAFGTYCPEGTGTKSCQTCISGPQNIMCQCAGKLIFGCQECFNNTCKVCKNGLTLVYGACYQKTDFGSCSSSKDCQLGTVCVNSKCIPCSLVDKGQYCNCGENLIEGCQVCDGNNGCQQCITQNGRQFIYGLGTCTDPGDCSRSETSFDCHFAFQCNTEIGNVCQPCGNSIYASASCNCGGNRKLFKCQACHPTEPATCVRCVYGYTLELAPNGWWCPPNFCTSESNSCLNGYSCPNGPIGITQCEPCISGTAVSCTCFYQQNCETCNMMTKKCATCLPGFVLTGEQCLAKTNICSQNGSYTCSNGYTCQGSIGSDCETCDVIKEFSNCNCGGKLQQNCKKCSSQECETCLEGYLLINGSCAPNMCGSQINTQNCQFGYYCPNSATTSKDLCIKCDIQQQECNCGLLLGCQTCGIASNTCENCFFGYEKNSAQQCQLKTNICDFEFCDTEFYCNNTFGQPCSSCSDIQKGQECKCGTSLQSNCIECDGNNCISCLSGFSSHQGNCVQNICISGGLSGTCAFGNYCPSGGSGNVSCLKCPSPEGKPCQCGADHCLTCGPVNNSCGTCLIGYQMNAANQCILKSNICDANSQSVLCSTGYYCKGTFGQDCTSCSMLELGGFCNCGGQNIQNCVQCNNDKQCARCLEGHLLDGGKCVQNFCNALLTQTNCSPSYQCPVGSKEHDPCLPCAEDIQSICNCGTAQKCTTCGVLQNTCKTCFRGHYLDISTQLCIEITDKTKNICDANDKSTRCNDQYFCNSVFGQFCSICTQITPEKYCNCSGELLNSCQLCNGKECQVCLTGYYLNGGRCFINRCSSTEPCSDGFYCSETTTTCIPCTVATDNQCVCGLAQNCQTCSNIPGQCQTCVEGFVLQNGQCVVNQPCVQPTDCGINQYCNAENNCDVCNNFQDQICNCGNLQNCQMCENRQCQSCVDGFQFDTKNQCTIPICTIPIPSLSYCAGPNKVDKCPFDQEQVNHMESACNCGDSVNCGYCEVMNQCDICMPGFILVNHQCYEQTPDFTGVCVTAPDSQFCQTNNSCILPPSCNSCLGVSAGYACNCDGNQVLNCTNCDGPNCTSCFTGFTLRDNVCIDACTETSQCQIGQFCQENGCVPCDGSSLCSCGSIIDCMNCNATGCLECRPNFELEDNKCDNCSVGYDKVNDECIKVEDENDNNTFIINTVFMVLGVTSVVGAIVGIIVFYARKPKRLSFQHRM